MIRGKEPMPGKNIVFSIVIVFLMLSMFFAGIAHPYDTISSPSLLNESTSKQPTSPPERSFFDADPLPRGTRSNGDELDLGLKWLDGYGTIMGYLNSIKSADVDNDGEVEVVFGNSEGYVYVMGESDGVFVEEWSTIVGMYAFGLSLDDVDNDGTIEIVSGNMDGYINIFGFDGTTYQPEWTSPDLGSDLYGLTTADIDDDGVIEIIAGASVSLILEDNLFVYSWSGSAYTLDWSYALTATMGYLGIFNIAVGDVNNDGNKEIVVGTYENEMLENDPPVNPIPPNPRPQGGYGGRFYVFPNSGGLPEWYSDDFGEWILGLGIDDTDGDGFLEIVVSLYLSSVQVYGYDNTPPVYSVEWNSEYDTDVDVSVYALTVGDIDFDGMAEIVVSDWYDIFIIKNTGSELDYEQAWELLGFDSYLYGLGNGHADDDGILEILIGSYYKIYVYGNGGSDFIMEIQSKNMGAMESICSADLDKDGVNEVFLGLGNGTVLTMDFNGTSWELEDSISVTDRTITHLALGDVDDDGDEEIIAVEGHTSISWNENFIFRSASSDSVVHIIGYETPTYIIEDSIFIDNGGTWALEVDDIDEDDIPEILLGGTGYDAVNEDPFVGQIEVLDYDEETGYELAWESYYFDDWVMGVAIGDVDGDGNNEILTEDYDEVAETDVIRIFEWNGNTYIEATSVAVESENYALDIGDIDHDGIQEIVSKGIFSGLLQVFGRSGAAYNQEWSTSQFTTFIDECFATTNLEDGEDEYLMFGELGVFIYEYTGSSYQQIWHTAEVPASIKTLHVADVDSVPGKEIVGSSGGYNFIYGAMKRPVAHMNVSSDTVEWGEYVEFDASLSYGIGDLEYLFDFGDGSNTGWITTPIVNYAYINTGTFSASLRVRDERLLESVDTVTKTITVYPPNQPPTAFIDSISPSPAKEGETVVFKGLASDDGTISTYQWESSRDGIISTKATFATSGLSVGTHTITFKVKDDRDVWSETDSASLRINKKNRIPVATIDSISPNPAEQGVEVSFSGHGNDEDGYIQLYDWESDIDGYLSSKSSFSVSTLSLGLHTISFKAMDNEGEWSSSVKATLDVVIPVNIVPMAIINSITPEAPKEGGEVIFIGHGVDEDGNIEAYYWESDIDGFLSKFISFSTTDLSVGTHVISFRVRDDNGEWSESTQTVLVVKKAPSEEKGFFDLSRMIENPLLLFITIIIIIAIVTVIAAAIAERKKKKQQPYYEEVYSFTD